MPTQRYELQELLSADVEAVSYQALDRETGELVEMRFPRPETEINWPHIRKRCRLSMLIKSPGVRVVRACESSPPSYVVLDPATGHTLKELVERQRPLPIEKRVRLLQSVNASLIVAHQTGLSHGRLTAENIGWSGALENEQVESERGICVLDFTRCPRNPRSDMTDDALQLADLWDWMGPDLESEGSDATAELDSLFQAMRSSEPTDRPSAAAIGCKLDAWLLRHNSGAATQRPLSAPELRLAATGDFPSPSIPTPSVESDYGQSSAQTFIGPAERQSFVEMVVACEPPQDAGAELRVGGQSRSRGATDPLADRETLGRFRLLSKLGEGGMGAVWKAEDPLDGSHVAIKVLRADRAQNELALKRFHREARLLAEVNNPHVANLLEINAEGNLHYIVLEFVEGSDLSRYLKERGRLPEREATAITADVARALLDAHLRGIVHRDLKPENILLCRAADGGSALPAQEFPRVKLTDFGLARHVDETESMQLTRAGSVLGTPLYMAPEQCSGSAETDVRADVYALGATLFHALIGHPPFEARTIMALIGKHVSEPAPRVRALASELSEAVEEIVAKCLQKNPDARYQSAGDMLRDLERLLRGEPTSIVSHPRLPAGDLKDVLDFEFTWDLTNSPEALWPHVSNTERLNRAIGLSAVDYTTAANPHGGSMRFAQFRKLGMAIAWEEHPFEWIEGRRMGVLREFKQGPWKWFISVVEMTPHGRGGTRLTHRIRILPLNYLGKTAARIEVGIKSRKALEKVYRHIDAALSGELGPSADPFEDAHPLSGAAQRKLEQRLQILIDRGVAPFFAQRLGEYLAEAPIQELARIRPLALAQRLAVDEKQMLAACLIGAHAGLLTMQWDIICPVCRIPSQVKDSLKAIQDHGSCEACQSDFALDFANSIELIFRIASDIQSTEIGVYCVGGPAHSPHVVAQIRLGPGERCELDLALTEGAYRLRGPQLPYRVEFRVLSHALAARWELSLARGPQPELPRQLKPGRQMFVLTNDAEHEITARIERTANRADACTAARAAATPLFRELFPGECLAPDQLVQVEQVTLLFTRLDQAERLYFECGDSKAFARLHEHFRTLDAIIRREGGSLVKTFAEGVCAVFAEPVSAVRAALAMRALAEPDLRVVIHRGPAMVATINDHLDYFGSTVSVTQQWIDARVRSEVLSGPRIVLTDSIARDPEIITAISAAANAPRLKPVTVAQGSSRDALFGYELESTS